MKHSGINVNYDKNWLSNLLEKRFDSFPTALGPKMLRGIGGHGTRHNVAMKLWATTVVIVMKNS